MFQTLKGSLQTRSPSMRTIQKTIGFKPSKDRYKPVPDIEGLHETVVSNPQRIATNSLVTPLVYRMILCFKPSKDRYKHGSDCDHARKNQEFQTLKGSLQTPVFGFISLLMIMFQTLKGSLQTGFDVYLLLPKSQVSNPQRIATNYFDTQRGSEPHRVSNPQRIATNLQGQKYFEKDLVVSNPQRIATNPLNRSLYHVKIGVSNPQRIATNFRSSWLLLLADIGFKPSKDRYKHFFN